MNLKRYILICLLLLSAYPAIAQEDIDLLDTPAQEGDLLEETMPIDDTPVQVIEPQNPVTPTEPEAVVPQSFEEGAAPEQPMEIINSDSVALEQETQPSHISFDGVNSETLTLDFRSLFFSPEQTDLAYSKMKRFKNTGGVVTTTANKLSDLAGDISEGADSGEKIYEHKMYYLSSILYPKDGKWTIWINNNKIRNEGGSADPVILSVTENNASFLFKAGQELAQYSPDYTVKLKKKEIDESEPEFDYRSADGNIQVSSITGDVRFKLKQNQTFSLFDLTITEGPLESQAAAAAALDAVAVGAIEPAKVDQVAKDINLLTPNGNGAAASTVSSPTAKPAVMPIPRPEGYRIVPATADAPVAPVPATAPAVKQ